MDGIVPDWRFLVGDIEILKRCDAIVMIPGWRKSEGARKEFDIAVDAFFPFWTKKVFLWEEQQEALKVEGGFTNG
jgi:hypothetical protein